MSIQTEPNGSTPSTTCITLRKPTALDGAAIHALIACCVPLDTNSLYCNLLQASHFADTAVLAEHQGQIIGFISGYRLPQQPNTLFVWQVAVASQARGHGLASRMLLELLSRQPNIEFLHTTITPSNQASWHTFSRLARTLNAPLNSRELFNREQHLANQHDTEMLVEIGPFTLPHPFTS